MLLTRELCGYEIILSRSSHIPPIVLQPSLKFHLLPRLLPHIHPEGGTFVQSLLVASEKAAPGRKHNNWSRVGGVLAGVAGTGKGGPRGVGGAH